MMSVRIVQIIMQVDGSKEYCAVSLPQACMEMLVPMIQALSDGPIKLVKLPGVKMVPLTELGDAA